MERRLTVLMPQIPPKITFQQAYYLKHAGKLVDTKVSMCIRDGRPCIHIQDFEFDQFDAALAFLQHVGRSLARDNSPEESYDEK